MTEAWFLQPFREVQANPAQAAVPLSETLHQQRRKDRQLPPIDPLALFSAQAARINGGLAPRRFTQRRQERSAQEASAGHERFPQAGPGQSWFRIGSFLQKRWHNCGKFPVSLQKPPEATPTLTSTGPTLSAKGLRQLTNPT